MPANLPPQYYEAEKRYRDARTNEERLVILKEMWAIMPKHKGTDKLQGDLKAKISELKKEMQKPRTAGRRTYSRRVSRQGAAQVVLIGPPNVGKSQTLSRLTKATPQVAPYPFTTQEPQVGMVEFEDIKIQLIDTPPITSDFIQPWLPPIIRSADLILLVVDLGSDEVLEKMDGVVRRLEESRIKLVSGEPEEVGLFGDAYKKTIILGNKSDLEGAGPNLRALKDLYADKFPIISTSSKDSGNGIRLKKEIYQALNIIRVYTKEPGKPADLEDPVVLKKGSIVLDAAKAIHKDFAHNLRYVRMWGSSKFDGQQVDRDHPLKDGDIVEFHL
jgi:ribosome-interacting GTPase 1